MGQQDGLWSGRLNVGRRTYYFDIKRAEKGDLYLLITETKIRGEDQYDRQRIFIDEVDAKSFGEQVQEAIRNMLANSQSPESDN